MRKNLDFPRYQIFLPSGGSRSLYNSVATGIIQEYDPSVVTAARKAKMNHQNDRTLPAATLVILPNLTLLLREPALQQPMLTRISPSPGSPIFFSGGHAVDK